MSAAVADRSYDSRGPSRLPPHIASVIDRGRLCYLSTVSPHDPPGPHISAMNFSFQHDPELGDVLVMTTRRDTLKYEAISKNSNVAVLLHDFEGRRGASGSGDDAATDCGTLAITIYGQAAFQTGPVAARMRAAHLLRNTAYSQFIADELLYSVFAVIPSSVLCCDVHDKVITWQPGKDHSDGSSSLTSSAVSSDKP
jgi:hypothetical protein